MKDTGHKQSSIIKISGYDRIDISEGIEIEKQTHQKECKSCHCWYFKDIGFKYEPHLCNA